MKLKMPTLEPQKEKSKRITLYRNRSKQNLVFRLVEWVIDNLIIVIFLGFIVGSLTNPNSTYTNCERNWTDDCNQEYMCNGTLIPNSTVQMNQEFIDQCCTKIDEGVLCFQPGEKIESVMIGTTIITCPTNISLTYEEITYKCSQVVKR